MVYAADFETTTQAEDCRVWAWGVMPVGHRDEGFVTGNSIETFVEFFNNNPGTYYFHNLRFDGTFILDYLFRQGYEWTTDKALGEKQLSTLIADTGQWYCMRVGTSNGFVEFRDSLKVLPMKISEMPKAFDLPFEKLEIEYTEAREIGHQLTKEETYYLHNDVAILSYALDFLYTQNQKRLTTGSNALHDYEDRIGKKEFKVRFPKLDASTFR